MNVLSAISIVYTYYPFLPGAAFMVIINQLRRSTCGANMEQILANSTWPDRANRMCSLKVENHIIHSKSAVSCRSVSIHIIQKQHLCIKGICLSSIKIRHPHHFPPKVVPSWLNAGLEGLPVCIGWNKRKKREEKISAVEEKRIRFMCCVFVLLCLLTVRQCLVRNCH